MSDSIVVDFNLLEQGAASLKASANTLDGYINDLLNAVKPMEDIWVNTGDSSAAQAYEQAKTQLIQAANDIVEVIGRFGTAVDTAHSDQLAMENSITQSFT